MPLLRSTATHDVTLRISGCSATFEQQIALSTWRCAGRRARQEAATIRSRSAAHAGSWRACSAAPGSYGPGRRSGARGDCRHRGAGDLSCAVTHAYGGRRRVWPSRCDFVAGCPTADVLVHRYDRSATFGRDGVATRRGFGRGCLLGNEPEFYHSTQASDGPRRGGGEEMLGWRDGDHPRWLQACWVMPSGVARCTGRRCAVRLAPQRRRARSLFDATHRALIADETPVGDAHPQSARGSDHCRSKSAARGFGDAPQFRRGRDMTSPRFEVKGWCRAQRRWRRRRADGAVRPGCAPSPATRTATQRLGNGHIDLTRRANLRSGG